MAGSQVGNGSSVVQPGVSLVGTGGATPAGGAGTAASKTRVELNNTANDKTNWPTYTSYSELS